MQDMPNTLPAIGAAALLQLVGTLSILAFVPGNAMKLVGFVILWAVTFRSFSRREVLCFVGVSVLFATMDAMAVAQGIFRFSHPDLGPLPMWEYFMWGFYVLHVLRTLDGPAPPRNFRLALPLAIVFTLPFSFVTDPAMLLVTSAVALAPALWFFHDRSDLTYIGYTVLVGALVEYVGVWSGQWLYPANPPGGVAFWFITMWGGIGLFIRRLVMPLVVSTPQRQLSSSYSP